MSAETYRRKAEELLRKAAETADMKDRGRLLDQAVHWHRLAVATAKEEDRPKKTG